MPDNETFESVYQETFGNNPADEDTAATNDQEDVAEDAVADVPTKDDHAEGGIEPDDAIREALKDNPQALKRFEEQLKGVEKLRNRYESEDIKKAEALLQALRDPDTAKVAWEAVGKELSEHYGWQKEESQEPEPQDFEYESEKIVFERAKAAAEAMTKPLMDELAKVKSELAKITGKAEEQDWLASNAATIKANAEKTMGWKVDDSMLREAKAAFPNEDPLVALKRRFPDEYAEAKVAFLQRPKQNGKPMIQGRNVGNSKPIPEGAGFEAMFKAAYEEEVASQ